MNGLQVFRRLGEVGCDSLAFLLSWGLGSMLNIYEPVAESGFGLLDMRSGNRGACKKNDCAAPSTAEQVLFLVESVYDVSGESVTAPDIDSTTSTFRGH